MLNLSKHTKTKPKPTLIFKNCWHQVPFLLWYFDTSVQSNNLTTDKLALHGWAVTFGTVTRGLDGVCPAAHSPLCCTKCNPSMKGQCTNHQIAA